MPVVEQVPGGVTDLWNQAPVTPVRVSSAPVAVVSPLSTASSAAGAA